jgi:hypothetical protein
MMTCISRYRTQFGGYYREASSMVDEVLGNGMDNESQEELRGYLPACLG